MNRRVVLAGLVAGAARAQSIDPFFSQEKRGFDASQRRMRSDFNRRRDEMRRDFQEKKEQMEQEFQQFVDQAYQDQQRFLDQSFSQNEDYTFRIHGEDRQIDRTRFQEDRQQFEQRHREDLTDQLEQNPDQGLTQFQQRQQKITELSGKQRLSRTEFGELVGIVTSVADYKKVMRERGIHYSPDNTRVLEKKLKQLYGPSLETFNDRTGVCDELAVLSLPFLLNIPDVKQVYLTEISEPGARFNHAFTVFQTEDGKWGYVNNTHVVDAIYGSRRGARNGAARETGYNTSRIDFDERKITQNGSWSHDKGRSSRLRPDKYRR